MKKPFIYLLFAFCFMSCTDMFHENVTSEFIASGSFSKLWDNFGFYYYTEIKDSVEWKQLINKIISTETIDSLFRLSDYFKEKNIDFSQFTVIAIFDRFNGTNYVPIDKILEYNTNIVVYLNYHYSIPGLYLFNFPVAYYIVKIKKTTKSITFE